MKSFYCVYSSYHWNKTLSTGLIHVYISLASQISADEGNPIVLWWCYPIENPNLQKCWMFDNLGKNLETNPDHYFLFLSPSSLLNSAYCNDWTNDIGRMEKRRAYNNVWYHSKGTILLWAGIGMWKGLPHIQSGLDWLQNNLGQLIPLPMGNAAVDRIGLFRSVLPNLAAQI